MNPKVEKMVEPLIDEIMNEDALISMDDEDIQEILEGTSKYFIAKKTAETPQQAMKAALEKPLHKEVAFPEITQMILFFIGNARIKDIDDAVQMLYDKLDPEVDLLWGISAGESTESTVIIIGGK